MLLSAVGWESYSVQYKGAYVIVMKNLALNTSISDASSCCSKENCAVASSVPRNPSNKMVTAYKIEIRAIFVAAFYKIAKMLHKQNYCFSPINC